MRDAGWAAGIKAKEYWVIGRLMGKDDFGGRGRRLRYKIVSNNPRRVRMLLMVARAGATSGKVVAAGSDFKVELE